MSGSLRWDPDPIESLVLSMASMIRPGDTWGVGMGTRLPLVALSLARTAGGVPFKVFLPEHGSYAVQLPGRGRGESGNPLTDGAVLAPVVLTHVFNEDLIHRYGEFFRPAQIDARGSINISAIGGNLLVGYAGISEAMQRYSRVYLFSPRHERRLFVSTVDCVTATVTDRSPLLEGDREVVVQTDLGVFDLDPAAGCLRVRWLAPTTTLDEVRDKTGFPVEAAADADLAQPERPELLAVLRSTVDPNGDRYH